MVLLWNNTFSHLPKHLDEVKKELRVDHPVVMAVVCVYLTDIHVANNSAGSNTNSITSQQTRQGGAASRVGENCIEEYMVCV